MTNEKDEKKEFVANGGKRLKLGDIDEETLNSGALGYDLVHFHYAEWFSRLGIRKKTKLTPAFSPLSTGTLQRKYL